MVWSGLSERHHQRRADLARQIQEQRVVTMRATTIGAALLLLVSLSGTVGAYAAELFVSADGSGDYPTIQAALDASAGGDEVVLGDGVFTEDGNRDVEIPSHEITIRSASGDPARTIIDCEGSAADPHVGMWSFPWGGEFEPLSLIGISITGAYDTDDVVGALAVANRPGTLRSCWFYGNVSERFETIIWMAGSITMDRCVIAGNVSRDGVSLIDAQGHLVDTTIATHDGLALLITTGALAPTSRRATPVLIERCVIWNPCNERAVWVTGSGVQAQFRQSVLDVDAVSVSWGALVTYLDEPLGEDPRFCDPINCTSLPGGPGGYDVALGSPCLPENNPWGVSIGGLGLGCAASPVETLSWSKLKARHR
jgi:hypothetical protein